jgi:RNA polymerase sigma-70 factor (ECF subfamily)
MRGEETMTDSDVLEQIRQGDEVACAALVRQYAPRMQATARRFLSCDDDCADAVQEAFLSAFRNLDSFAGQASLGTWLHRILVNACLMKLRARSRRRLVPLDDLLPACRDDRADALARDEARARVRACIESLPEPHRTILWLRDIEEYDTDQTARRLGITPGAVKTRLHRARHALRPLLEPLVLGGMGA